MLDSSARRAFPHSSRTVRRASRSDLVAAATAVVLCLLLAGCSGDNKAAPKPSPTPIANLNSVAMKVPRIEFCPLVPHSAISDALGGKPGSQSTYGNGDEEELPGVGKDVVHEIGCSWTGKDGTTARAWVFARPITAAFAHTVIASDNVSPGCRTVPGPAYGQPATTQLCRLPSGEQRVRHSGLFGQTWLSCELAATGLDQAVLRTRTDRWCVEVANSLNTAR
jgi:hypothetical protein